MEYVHDLTLLLKYIFLGFFQGFTEPIPISSSGHLVLLRSIFDINIQGLSFEIFVHFGSLIAIIIAYRKDIFRLVQNGLAFIFNGDQRGKSDFHFIILLFFSTIPTALIGLLFEDYISQLFKKNLFIIGITLLITGIALWMIRNLQGHKKDKDITIKDAFIIGMAQAIALLPGISRSGATIVTAMLLGMKQETALRFSFLLYIPVSFGATILSVRDMVNDPLISSLVIPYLVALIAAIIATFYSLKWFIGIMAKGNLKYFAYYCFAVGIITIAFFI